MERLLDDLSLFAMSVEPDFSWARTRREIADIGSPSAVLESRFDGQLLNAELDAVLENARRLEAQHNERGINVSTIWGHEYPRHLRDVHDAPPVLYWQGDIGSRDELSVAVVGTRAPDAWGVQFAQDLAAELAAREIPVISGLARGIDGEAMRSSLHAGGRTIGVIGTGIGVYYPAEHRALQNEVAQHLLLSQFAPGASASKKTFPMRNVVMSGYASATLIVQAGETSGTRIQARAAVKHGRPLVVTTRVLDRADWARDLVRSDYDVTVVTSSDEGVEAIVRIHERMSAAAADWHLGALFAR